MCVCVCTCIGLYIEIYIFIYICIYIYNFKNCIRSFDILQLIITLNSHIHLNLRH